MIEQQRLHYLASLGIDAYVPRRILANAAVSSELVACEFEPEITEPQVITHSTVDALTTEPIEAATAPENIVEIDDAQVEQNAPPLRDSAAEQAPVIAQPSPKIANTPLRFALSLWVIAPQLVVIDTRRTGSALPTDKLLQNLLRAMGYPLAQLPPSELIRWPIFKNDPQANNSEEAFAMVQANIHARCSQGIDMQLMVMGETAAQFIVSHHEHYQSYEQSIGQAIQSEKGQYTATILPSLVELLEEPSKKALVWQAVQPLLAPK